MKDNRGCKRCPECTARHIKADPCPTCSLCGAHRTDHHRNSRGQTVWCVATDRTWPAAPLVAKAGTGDRLCELLGISRGSLPLHLSDVQADRWAIHCGWHPNQVWPGWSDAGLRYVDRVFVEQGGWRPAWLEAEQPPAEAEEAA